MAAIPLLVFPFLILNALILFTTGGINAAALSFTLPSGADWALSVGDLVIAGSLILLYFEIFKSTRTGTTSIVDHMLSLLLFVAVLLEFLLLKGAGTTGFFLLGVMCLVDVVAGFTVSISVARRDIDLVGGQS